MESSSKTGFHVQFKRQQPMKDDHYMTKRIPDFICQYVMYFKTIDITQHSTIEDKRQGHGEEVLHVISLPLNGLPTLMENM